MRRTLHLRANQSKMDRIIHKLIAVVVISVVVYPVVVIPVVASILLFYAGVQMIRKLD